MSQPGGTTCGRRPPGSNRSVAIRSAGLRLVWCLRLEDGALRNDALGRIAPERHQQLTGERHDRDSADPPSTWADALAEPDAQGGVGLMAQPEPGQLDHGLAQA